MSPADYYNHDKVADPMTYWYFLDGPDQGNPDRNLLAVSPAGVGFQIEAAGLAPSPATALLSILGLAGTGHMNWTITSARARQRIE